MGDSTVGLDSDRAAHLGSACGDVSGVAGGLASEVSTALGSARLPRRAGSLLSELEYELAMLGRVIAATVERVQVADSWWLSRSSGLVAGVVADIAERLLWDSLNDPVGATAFEVGPFRLDQSFRVMDRGAWRAAMTLPGCESFGPDRYYAGGGALVGPDNRLYPIVVPHLVVDDRQHFTIDADITDTMPSAASLGGADPGWTMVDYRTGIDRIQSEPGTWWKTATGAAVATGLGVALGVDDVQLAGVRLRAGSAAAYERATPVASDNGVPEGAGAVLAGREPTVWLVVDGRAGDYPISEVPDLPLSPSQRRAAPGPNDTALGRMQTAGNVFTLAAQAETGFVAARDLDHGRHRAYEVIFEENVDGRRRARVQSFTLEAKQWGTELYGWHLFVDPDGGLRQSPVSYQYGPLLTTETTRIAHNPADPNFSTRVPAARFGGSEEPF